jgi:hydrogenase/urease accessory protein HupE
LPRNRKPCRGPDLAALSRIAVLGGCVLVDGERLPLVRPLSGRDHMAFDAAVCRAGLTAFVRPRMESDWPASWAGHNAAGANAALVRQARPGVRVRLLLSVVFPELN